MDPVGFDMILYSKNWKILINFEEGPTGRFNRGVP